MMLTRKLKSWLRQSGGSERVAAIEPLEGRTLLAAAVIEPGDSNLTAQNLGAIVGGKTVRGALSDTDRADRFKFSVASRGNFNVWLRGLLDNADVQLLNSRGNVIQQSRHTGTRAERLSLSLNRGTYYLRVAGADADVRTDYVLRMQADLNWGTVRSGAERSTVGLVFADGAARPIRWNRPMWVVIHGWNSTPRSLSRLSEAIDSHVKGDQVLVLDWSDAAESISVIDAAFWGEPVASFAAGTLERWGIPSAQINLAGHSLGGYVAGRLASEMEGGVNRIIVIDPATGLLGLLFNVNYAANSRFSTAFIASRFSTESAAATADQSFRVDVGDFNSILSHANVVDLVASMIEANNGRNPDAISELFALERMSPVVSQPWKTNAFSGGFEGAITGVRSDGHWEPAKLVYTSKTTGREVVVRA